MTNQELLAATFHNIFRALDAVACALAAIEGGDSAEIELAEVKGAIEDAKQAAKELTTLTKGE